MPYSYVSVCPSCGTANRVPAKHLASSGRCGACQAKLPPVGKPIDVSTQAFEEIVGKASVPILVDFWASWCGPCRMIAPELHELAKEVAGRALILKVDTEAEPALSARFGVRSIPNLIVFAGGQPVAQHAGVSPRAEMRRWLEQAASVGYS